MFKKKENWNNGLVIKCTFKKKVERFSQTIDDKVIKNGLNINNHPYTRGVKKAAITSESMDSVHDLILAERGCNGCDLD